MNDISSPQFSAIGSGESYPLTFIVKVTVSRVMVSRDV